MQNQTYLNTSSKIIAITFLLIICRVMSTNKNLKLLKMNPSYIQHGNYNGFINTDGSATCTDCKIEKTNNNFIFYKNRVNPITNLCLYVNKKCSDCRKLYLVHKKKSTENVKRLNIIRPTPSVDKPYRCDCCDKNIFTTKTIQLDHCHETGLFRGWLCKECNISMGNLGDNILGIMRVVRYMNKTEKIERNELNEIIDDIIYDTKFCDNGDRHNLILPSDATS